MHELLVQWAGYVIPWIEALGIVMVLWGIVEALLALSRRAWRAAAGHTALGDLGAIRLAMGEETLLGLEFFLWQQRGDPHRDRLLPELGVEPGFETWGSVKHHPRPAALRRRVEHRRHLPVVFGSSLPWRDG